MGLPALIALAAMTPTHIAYLSHDGLYVLKCDASGAAVSRPIRVCAMRGGYSLRWNGGQIEVQVSDDTRYTVKPLSGAKPRKVVQGEYIRYPSPTGNATIVVHDYSIGSTGREDAYLIDSKGKKIVLAENIWGEVLWSPRGDMFGLIKRTGDDGIAELIQYPELRKERGLGESLNMSFDTFSPDGKWVSLDYGPLEYRSASIVDTSTGRRTVLPGPRGWAEYVRDWSPDSSKIVLDYDGTDEYDRFTKHALALYDIPSGKVRQIANTKDAVDPMFSPDGRHLLWIDSKRQALVSVDLANTEKRRVIAKSVRRFALQHSAAIVGAA